MVSLVARRKILSELVFQTRDRNYQRPFVPLTSLIPRGIPRRPIDDLDTAMLYHSNFAPDMILALCMNLPPA
jgi:hypothetical protein